MSTAKFFVESSDMSCPETPSPTHYVRQPVRRQHSSTRSSISAVLRHQSISKSVSQTSLVSSIARKSYSLQSCSTSLCSSCCPSCCYHPKNPKYISLSTCFIRSMNVTFKRLFLEQGIYQNNYFSRSKIRLVVNDSWHVHVVDVSFPPDSVASLSIKTA